jgi:hypothetical protein
LGKTFGQPDFDEGLVGDPQMWDGVGWMGSQFGGKDAKDAKSAKKERVLSGTLESTGVAGREISPHGVIF